MLSYSRKHLQRCSPSLSFVWGSNSFKLPSFKFDMYTTLLSQEENYRRYKHRDKCKHSVRCLHQFGPTNETSDMHKSSCFHWFSFKIISIPTQKTTFFGGLLYLNTKSVNIWPTSHQIYTRIRIYLTKLNTKTLRYRAW